MYWINLKGKITMLNEVLITKFDTCLTYALKRINLEYLIDKGLTSIKYIETYFELMDFDINLCQEGLLICWDSNQDEILIPNHISPEGIITENLVVRHYHLGVIEDFNLVSDCTRKVYDGIPCIRMRNFDNVRYPDKYLILKDDYRFR